MTRRAARTDLVHQPIVDALRRVGVSVQSLAGCSDGVPDLLCGVGGENLLLELKTGTKAPSARKLTPDQVKWHDSWRGTVHVVESVEQALAIVGAVRRAA